jgi:hypothetical protein
MKHIKFLKIIRTLTAAMIFLACFIIFEEIFAYYNKYSHYTKIFYFIWNSFHKTHIKTDNFEINIDKLEWFFLKESDTIAFLGNIIYANETLSTSLSKAMEKKYTKAFYVDTYFSKDKGFFPMIKLEKLTNKTYRILELLDTYCNKSYGQINDWNATVYDCKTEYDDVPKRYVIYKNEAFILPFYIDLFQSQYDKFFEGVRLKE